MRNIQYRIAQFMYGRYGFDQMYYGLIILYFIIAISNMFLRIRFVNTFAMILFFYSFFRVFSRNIPKRRRENETFLRLWDKFTPDFKFWKMRFKQFRTHALHKCPYCGSVLRFPRKRGKFPVKCPKCNMQFSIRNWF